MNVIEAYDSDYFDNEGLQICIMVCVVLLLSLSKRHCSFICLLLSLIIQSSPFSFSFACSNVCNYFASLNILVDAYFEYMQHLSV